MADFIGIRFRLEEVEKMLAGIQIGINRSCILKYYNHVQSWAAIIGDHLAKNLHVSSTNAWRINNLITGIGLLLFNTLIFRYPEHSTLNWNVQNRLHSSSVEIQQSLSLLKSMVSMMLSLPFFLLNGYNYSSLGNVTVPFKVLRASLYRWHQR